MALTREQKRFDNFNILDITLNAKLELSVVNPWVNEVCDQRSFSRDDYARREIAQMLVYLST